MVLAVESYIYSLTGLISAFLTVIDALFGAAPSGKIDVLLGIIAIIEYFRAENSMSL